MPEQITMDGEPLEVGDKVWCLLRGWLKFDGVFRIGVCAYFPLRFIDKNGEQVTYTQAFQNMAGSNRTLYWDEIKITPPPKPKKKVKVWDWFVQWDDSGVIERVNKTTMKDLEDRAERRSMYYSVVQKIDGTEREVER